MNINVILAMVPLIIAIAMLVGLQQSGLRAGLATMLTAVLLAILVPSFHLAPSNIVIAMGEGIATSLTVLWVLFPALLLYHIQRITGNINILSRGITRLCPDQDVQVLMMVLGLSPLLESISGFGVGVVVIIPMLSTLGIDDLEASVLGLLGQLAVPWGGLAVGIVLGATLTKLDANLLGAYTALLNFPLPVGFGLVALAISGGRKRLRRLWPAAVAGGLVLFGGEWLFSQVPGVELAGVIASIPTIALLAIWGHISFNRSTQNTLSSSEDMSMPSIRDLFRAGIPYLFLIISLLISRLIPPLQDWLQTHAILAIPAIGLNFPLLYHPGFYLLLSVFVASLLSEAKDVKLPIILKLALRQFTPAAISIVSFLIASQIMGVSGMITVLGNAAATLGSGYSWIAPCLGSLGGWLTGSNAGSNAMLARLQQEASLQAGLPLNWVMGAQNAAASIATMVSPSRIILATSTVGIIGKEGQLLRRLGPLILIAILLISLLLFGVILVTR